MGRILTGRALDELAVSAFLLGLLFLVVGAEWLAPFDPTAPNVGARLAPPSWFGSSSPYFLGTDSLGRDLLSRLIYGTRWSLGIAFSGAFLATALGLVLGLVSGFLGGVADLIVMRLVDTALCFSGTLVVMILVALIGISPMTLVLAFALVRWVACCRVVRSNVLSLREAVFIQAAVALGASRARIWFVHLAPHLVGVVVSIFIVEAAALMFMESGLSFIGFGIQRPAMSWGLVLAEGRPYMETAWWLVTFPGVAIMITILALNIVSRRRRG